MTNNEARDKFDILMQEAQELLNQKEYNKVLAKIQTMRNLLRVNNVLDNVMSTNLDKLHKLVLEYMN